MMFPPLSNSGLPLDPGCTCAEICRDLGSSCHPLLLDTTPSENFGLEPSIDVSGYPIVDTRSPSVMPLEDANWNGRSGHVVASFVASVTRKTARSFTISLTT